MSDNPLDSIPSYDRVSIRAVLVRENDHGTALAEAGLVDPLVIPVMVDGDVDFPAHFIGDGVTGNLTAVLEPNERQPADGSAADDFASAEPAPTSATPSGPGGHQPAAGVRSAAAHAGSPNDSAIFRRPLILRKA